MKISIEFVEPNRFDLLKNRNGLIVRKMWENKNIPHIKKE